MTTKYKTRSGLKARVLCVDLLSGNDGKITRHYPVVAAITKENGCEVIGRFTKHGLHTTGYKHPYDIMVPVTVTMPVTFTIAVAEDEAHDEVDCQE